MQFVCLDLEGVLIPEIWLTVAAHTGVEEFKLTTREVADYDELMRHRLNLLERHRLDLPQLQSVIASMKPLPGASEFLHWLRPRFQLAILSDTFYEFASPLMRQLGWPTLLCHRLQIDADGRIDGYRLRQADPKRHAVAALQQLQYRVIAAGDSYNDISMLSQAEHGILFRPSDRVVADHPRFPVVGDYAELSAAISAAAES